MLDKVRAFSAFVTTRDDQMNDALEEPKLACCRTQFMRVRLRGVFARDREKRQGGDATTSYARHAMRSLLLLCYRPSSDCSLGTQCVCILYF